MPLAEVALQAIIDLHAPVADGEGRLQCQHCSGLCHSRSGLSCDDPDAPFPCETIRLIAGTESGDTHVVA